MILRILQRRKLEPSIENWVAETRAVGRLSLCMLEVVTVVVSLPWDLVS